MFSREAAESVADCEDEGERKGGRGRDEDSKENGWMGKCGM